MGGTTQTLLGQPNILTFTRHRDGRLTRRWDSPNVDLGDREVSLQSALVGLRLFSKRNVRHWASGPIVVRWIDER